MQNSADRKVYFKNVYFDKCNQYIFFIPTIWNILIHCKYEILFYLFIVIISFLYLKKSLKLTCSRFSFSSKSYTIK